MPATLVVVDMQQSFDAACDPDVVIGVTQEILFAKQKGGAVILVEYHNCGNTHSGFSRLLRNYPYKSRIRKRDDDGSQEVLRAIRRRGFNQQWLRICGVNADCCVYATIQGFLHRLPHAHIDVVKDACGTFDRKFDWRSYIRHPNLVLV